MGYCMSQVESNFSIAKEDFPHALEAMRAMAGDDVHYDWIEKARLAKAKTIQEAFQEWGWGVTFEDEENESNIDSISFDMEKKGSEEAMFAAIAPWVEDGSYIEMSGEENDHWKWVFQDGEMKEKNGTIVWK
jgi:hypothetical protein